MATAILQFRVNGGAVQTGTEEVAAEDEVDLLAASYAGWQSARFEVQEYPPGFPQPTGWSTDASSGAYYYNYSPTTGITPPTITMPNAAAIEAGQWGKWIFRVIVRTAAGTLTSDPRCGVYIPSPALGLKGLGYTEEAEFGGSQRSYIADYQHDQRQLETHVGSAEDAALWVDATSAPAAFPSAIPTRAVTSTLDVASSTVTPLGTTRTAAAAGSVQLYRFRRRVTATNEGEDGTGGYLSWVLPSALAVDREALRIESVWTSAGSTNADAVFYVRLSDGLVERLRIRHDGHVMADGGLDTKNSNALRLGRENATSLELNSVSGQVVWQQGQTPVRTDTFTPGGACTSVLDASASSCSWTWTADSTAAGGNVTLTGQRGFTGFAGGSWVIHVGDGGTLGTNSPGNFDVGLGTPVSNVSGRFRLLTTAGTVIAEHRSMAGIYYRIANGSYTTGGIYVQSNSLLQLEGTLSTLISTSNDVWLQPSTGSTRFYRGSTLNATFAHAENAAQGLTMAARSGTGANNGAAFDLKAQPGQQQTGVAANTVGGVLRVSSGLAGSGGSGADGTDGDSIIRTGNTERIYAKGDGSFISLTADTLSLTGLPTYFVEEAAYASTISLSTTARYFEVTLTGDVEFTDGPGQSGCEFTLIAYRDAAVAPAITWPANYLFDTGAGENEISAADNTYTIWQFYIDMGGFVHCTNRRVH